MSALKEEWANLMKLRGSGRVEENKTEDIKSRLFQTFHHMLKDHVTDFPSEFNKVQVKPEFEALRTKVQGVFQGIIERDQDSKNKINKQFTFGLNPQRSKSPIPTMPKPKNENIDIKKGIDSIWKTEEIPMKNFEDNFPEPKFEIFSIANKDSAIKHTELLDREISIFGDLSPVARFMTNIATEEEDQLLSGKNNQSELFSQVHLLQIDISKINLDKIEWADASHITLGRIPKKTLLRKIKNLPEETDSSITVASPVQEESTNMINKTVNEAAQNLQNSSEFQVPLKKNTTMPNMYISENNNKKDDELEAQLEEMMEIIKSQQEGDINDIDEKLQHLLDYMNTKIKNNPNNPKILEFKMIFQFLTEYKKAREGKIYHSNKQHMKPAVPKIKRYSKAKHSPPKTSQMPQSSYYYSPKSGEQATTTVMKEGWSTSSKPSVLNARYAPVKKPSTKIADSPKSYQSRESQRKHSFHNNTASSSNKMKNKPFSPPPAEVWIGGSRHQVENDEVWIDSKKAFSKQNVKSFDQSAEYDVVGSNDIFRNDKR
ncbi:unnamed protein product [Blepharisma stoltei]|uniref:Uncharacterized protein n=1 Tax=Blepharisma stoltei TaxID=1481888 RepID=A0AAU9JC87_9CILI|nr:unnamed protein product [Blepharisma stoltei]